MAFRHAFACLWCGASWTVRAPGDLEGWTQLCADCLGKAGSNPFLRSRLRDGLRARAAAADGGGLGVAPAPTPAGASAPTPAGASAPAPAAARGSAGAFPDDWFLRRGPFEHGAIHDAAWAAELDTATRWLDGQPIAGRIVELAAGTGFFSPLLAERGELFAFDADGAALLVARERLVAHHLRAHLHVADPWAPLPPQADPTPADSVVAAFLLGRVRGAGLDAAAALLRSRLGPGGRLAVIDLRPDPAGGPPEGVAWTWHDPSVLEASLLRAGFGSVTVAATGRFFLTAAAIAR